MAISKRFLEPLKNPKDYLENTIEFVRENVSDDEKVVCALSGGVDSSVVTKIFHRAIGSNLYPIHFDTGFMRSIQGKDETKLVARMFDDVENFKLIDKRDIFYDRIFGIEDSEEKRKAFRRTYVEVLNEQIRKIGANAITQGTINPDIQETETHIKSQNNVDTDFDVEKLVEPIAGLYKPDVRLLAKELGFSKDIYLRQPFLGPGLSARTVGSINKEKLANEKRANDLVEQFIEGYYRSKYGSMAPWDRDTGNRIPFQYFAGTFDQKLEPNEDVNEFLTDLGLDTSAFTLNNRATGLKINNGERSRLYSYPVLLKGNLGSDMVHYLGKRIPEIFDCSRVLYQLSSREEGEWIVAVRVINSKDALNVQPLKISLEKLEVLADRILGETDIGIVTYDVTPKPPATVEYE